MTRIFVSLDKHESFVVEEDLISFGQVPADIRSPDEDYFHVAP
jgi:hypothetical protein